MVARLKWAVLDDGEKTSEKRKKATAPCSRVRRPNHARGGGPTVAITPTATMARLKLCCVVRTTFSPGDRSDQRTCPVSPVNVMDFLCGADLGLLAGLWAACALGLVEKAARWARRARRGGMRESMSDGRSSAMASVGRYTAAMLDRGWEIVGRQRLRPTGAVVKPLDGSGQAEAARRMWRTPAALDLSFGRPIHAPETLHAPTSAQRRPRRNADTRHNEFQQEEHPHGLPARHSHGGGCRTFAPSRSIPHAFPILAANTSPSH